MQHSKTLPVFQHRIRTRDLYGVKAAQSSMRRDPKMRSCESENAISVDARNALALKPSRQMHPQKSRNRVGKFGR